MNEKHTLQYLIDYTSIERGERTFNTIHIFQGDEPCTAHIYATNMYIMKKECIKVSQKIYDHLEKNDGAYRFDKKPTKLQLKGKGGFELQMLDDILFIHCHNGFKLSLKKNNNASILKNSMDMMLPVELPKNSVGFTVGNLKQILNSLDDKDKIIFNMNIENGKVHKQVCINTSIQYNIDTIIMPLHL